MGVLWGPMASVRVRGLVLGVRLAVPVLRGAIVRWVAARQAGGGIPVGVLGMGLSGAVWHVPRGV